MNHHIRHHIGKEEAKALVKDLIIGFGVLEGLWIYAGVDPEKMLFEELLKLISNSILAFEIKLMLFLIPIVQILAVYLYGGVIGVLALLIAFIGGIFISNLFGILSIFIGLILGYYAFRTQTKIWSQDVIYFIKELKR